jgi:hypothetical protein
MRLGDLLLLSGKVSAESLQEALESQVVHGGRLGTNLVELGLLEERDLAEALGKLHGVHFASGKMAPDPRALGTVEPAFADEHDLLPMRMDATRLSVAVINPGDLATLDALAFKTGRRVVPVVIPEFRMHQLLRAHCRAFRTLRAIDIEGPRQRQAAKAEAPGGEELMSEEAFQALYAQAITGQAEAPAAPVRTLGGIAPTSGSGEPTDTSARGAPPAASAGAPPAAPTSAPPASPPVPAPLAGGTVPAGALEGTLASPILLTQRRVEVPKPLGFQEAQERLAASTDREAIAQTVLRFALGKWKRVLLLSVQRGLLLGWHGMGPQLDEAAVRQMAIPLRPGNTFRLVRDTRSHFIGPLKRDAATVRFFQWLGGGLPTTAVVLPLLVRGKVVHILYVDNGPDQLTLPDVGELLILSQSVARSYEALIARRARGG